MKSLYISLSIFAFLLIGQWLFFNQLSKNVDELNIIADEIISALSDNDIEAAREKTNDLNDKLKAVELFLLATIPHNELDNINLANEALKAYINFSEIPEAMDKIYELKFMFEHLLECEELSLGNIL